MRCRAGFGPSIVTIGNFDGVHCGHQSVIREGGRTRAAMRSAKAILVTLDPHPAAVLRPDRAPRLITPLEGEARTATPERASTRCCCCRLLEEFSRTTPRAFCETILRDGLHAIEVHEGENFRFGYGAEADMHSLESLGEECCFTAHVFAPLQIGRETVSSSRIRSYIAAGEMSAARHMLGRPFFIDSTPARGRGYGTHYAVPTINLAAYTDLLPANGVYVTDLRIGTGDRAIHFEGVTNVGNRPTFGADSFAVETYLLRFQPVDLQEDTPLRLTFLKRLREEKKWPSTEALKQQIGIDVARAERWFALRRALPVERSLPR